MTKPLALALVHHPVVDRRGDEVTTAVTNLDLHDIARSAATFGVSRVYAVTPVAEQQRLVARLVGHWTEGHGAGYNPDRAEALGRIEVVATLDEAHQRWERECGESSRIWLTGAQRHQGLSSTQARQLLGEQPALLVFGTGSGLAPRLFENDWPVLAAIRGPAGYNHLPVRAAAAIYLDRLFGNNTE